MTSRLVAFALHANPRRAAARALLPFGRPGRIKSRWLFAFARPLTPEAEMCCAPEMGCRCNKSPRQRPLAAARGSPLDGRGASARKRRCAPPPSAPGRARRPQPTGRRAHVPAGGLRGPLPPRGGAATVDHVFFFFSLRVAPQVSWSVSSEVRPNALPPPAAEAPTRAQDDSAPTLRRADDKGPRGNGGLTRRPERR